MTTLITPDLWIGLISRVALRANMVWIVRLTHPMLRLAWVKLSGRGLTPIGGGRFLIVKSTSEIHGRLDKARCAVRTPGSATTVPDVVAQIIPFATDAITEFVEHHLIIKVLACRSWCSSAPISWPPAWDGAFKRGIRISPRPSRSPRR